MMKFEFDTSCLSHMTMNNSIQLFYKRFLTAQQPLLVVTDSMLISSIWLVNFLLKKIRSQINNLYHL